MHYIFGIIVKKDDEQEAKREATDVLDNYLNDIYDWYKDLDEDWDGCSRNIIPATDEQFAPTVRKLIDYQKNEFRYCLARIKDSDFYNDNYEGEEEYRYFEDGCYELLKWSKYVSGTPMTSSYIFDVERLTSRITKAMVENYAENADKYYIVLFDIHN